MGFEMKKYILFFILSMFTIQSFASLSYRENMQNYLQKNELQQHLQQKGFSFNFKEMDIIVLRNLLGSEKKVKVIIDSGVNTNNHFPINLRNSNFLEFLELTTQKLGLRYEVLDPKTIRIYK
mgnify:CR=1 FL=1